MSGIRELPKQDKRVETGTVRFGDDWPGLFIRGDDCMALNMALGPLARLVKTLPSATDRFMISQGLWILGLAKDATTALTDARESDKTTDDPIGWTIVSVCGGSVLCESPTGERKRYMFLTEPEEPEEDPYKREYLEIPDCYGVFNRRGELQYVIRKYYEHLATGIPPEYSKQKLFRGDRTDAK